MKETSLESCSALACQSWVAFRQAEHQSLQTRIPDLMAASVSPRGSQKCVCLSSHLSPTFTGAWPHHTWPPVGMVLFEDKRLSLESGACPGAASPGPWFPEPRGEKATEASRGLLLRGSGASVFCLVIPIPGGG